MNTGTISRCRLAAACSLFVLFAAALAGQTSINMTSGSSTGCSFNFYDSGGPIGNYSNNENFTYTFTASAPGEKIRIVWNSFAIESSYDYLRMYDGPTTTSGQIGYYRGTNAPPTVTTSGSSLTIKFYSNGGTNNVGWSASVSCVTCSGAPAAATTTLVTPTTCVGYPFVLGLSTNYNESFTYQWQDAANAGGPFADIPGATGKTLTADLSSTTARHYRCAITCGVSGQTTFSSVRTVTPSGSTLSVTCPPNITVCSNPVNYTPAVGTATNSTCIPGAFPGYTLLGEYNGHYYFYYNGFMDWLEAKAAAASLGGHLASITSSGENDFIKNALPNSVAYTGNYWIGLNDATTEGAYVWENGDSYSYANWDTGEPNNSNDEDYVELRPNGKWNDTDYYNNQRYIVEIPATIPASLNPTLTAGLASGSNFNPGTTAVTYSYGASSCTFNVTLNLAPAPSITCPSNMTVCANPIHYPTPLVSAQISSCLPTNIPHFSYLGQYGGHAYFLSHADDINGGTSPNAAWDAAATLGVKLASITTSGELDFLKNALQPFNTTYYSNYWIGLNDVAAEGTYVWASGEPFSYSNWASGEPDNHSGNLVTNADHVSMNANDGKWSDNEYNYSYSCGGAGQCSNNNNFKYILEIAPGDPFIEHPAPTLVSGPASGSTVPVGVAQTVNYSYGSASCSFTVTVDEPAPVVTCPPNITTCTSPVVYPTPVAYIPSDDCLPTVLSGFTFVGALGGHHYFLSDKTQTWRNADNIAANMGAHLVSIGSAAEQAMLAQAVFNFGKDVWLGLNDLATEGSYVWTNGEALSYTNYASGEPNNAYADYFDEDLTVMQWLSGKWNDVHISHGYDASGSTPPYEYKYHYLLEIEPNDFKNYVTPTLLSGPPSGTAFPTGNTTVTWGYGDTECSFTVNVINPTANVSCPFSITTCSNPVFYATPTASVPCQDGCLPTKIPNYTFLGAYNGHHYFRYNLQSNFSTAKLRAAGRGGYLASITSAGENEFLRAALYSFGKDAFIGLNDSLSEGSYDWANGEPVSYTNWRPGEPNNGGSSSSANEDATVLLAYRGLWNDVVATTFFTHIMEMEVGTNYTESVPLVRTAGLPSGADFPTGLNTVTYAHGDASCSFFVTRNEPSATLTCPPDLTVCANPVNYPTPSGTVDCSNCTLPTTQDGMTYLGTYQSHNYFLSNNIISSSNPATITGSMPWAAAWQEAQNRGGHLATITTSGENSFLQGAVAAVTSSGAWLGANDEYTEGTFVWENGEPLSYTNWNSGEPNNTNGGQDYGLLSPSTGKWSDENASTNNRYILEMECNQRITPSLQSGLASGSNFPSGTSTVTYAYGGSTCSFTVTLNTSAPTATHCPPDITVCQNPVFYPTPTADISCAACDLPTSLPGMTYMGTYDGHAFFRSNAKATWQNAEEIAVGLGGHLASVTSSGENDFVKTAAGVLLNSVWLGLNDIATEGTYVFTDGDALGYTNWASSEPNNGSTGGNEDAVVLSFAGTWNDLPANSSSTTNYFVIEIACPSTTLMTQTAGTASGGNFPSGTSTVTYSFGAGNCSFTVNNQAATPSISCPPDITTCLSEVYYPTPTALGTCGACNLPTALDGYTYLGTLGGHAYFRSNFVQTWPTAKNSARAVGGYLASVTSSEENVFLKNFVSPTGFNHWLGLSDAATEGTFAWENGEAFNYQYWVPGEPANRFNEDFVEMLASNGKWNDRTAPTLNYFLVEFDNCDVDAVPNLTNGLASGSTFPEGTSAVTWAYNGATCTFNVTVEPTTAPTATATPSTLNCGETAQLNGTSPTGGYVNWYTQPSGGTALGSSDSGENFPVNPSGTTTYYAETADSTLSGAGLLSVTDTFNYTGAIQTWTAPSWVTSIDVDAWGAGGGSAGKSGGYGGRVKTTIPVTPGATYTFVVGGRGEIGGGRMGGGGGGWTGIKLDTTFLVVAGAGGGASANASQCGSGSAAGGNGGGPDAAQDGANGSCNLGGAGGAAVSQPTVGAGGGGDAVVPGAAGTALGGGVGGLTLLFNGLPAAGGGGSYGLEGAPSSFQPNGNFQFSTGGAGGFGGGGGGGGHNTTVTSPVAIRSNGGGGGGGYAGGAGGSNDYDCSICGAGGGGGGSSFVTLDGENTVHTQGGGSDPDDDGHLFITHAAQPQLCPAAARTSVTVTVNSASISMQPQNASVCNATTASFSVSVTGGTATYQWQQKIGAASFTNITNGGNFSGATTATLNLTGLTSAFNGRQYRCVLTPSSGCAAFNSNAATLTFNNVTAGNVSGNQTICPGGDPAAFNSISFPSGSGTQAYRWEKSTTDCTTNFSTIPGATATTYNEPAGIPQTTYFRRVAVYTQNGQTCEAASNCITVTTSDFVAPSITCPASQTASATNGSYTLADFTPLATTTDNCPLAPTKTQSPAVGTSLPLGNHTITITATDGGGNSASCSFTLNVVPSCPATGSVWYVSGTAVSGGNGSSWDCAFQNLQDAINAASSGQEIWVKAGTYKPTKDPSGNANPANAREKVFYLKSGVAVYGGFAGTETARTQRNWATNATILSGDIGSAGSNLDNCYHVVLSVSDAATTVLDGFSIQNGNANGTSVFVVEGKLIARNQGGGLYSDNSTGVWSNCIVSSNASTSGGAGMENTNGSNGSLTNVLFSGNSGSKGALSIYESSPTLFNCTFSGNNATTTGNGGGITNSISNPVLKNCLIWNNRTNGITGSATASMANFNGGTLDISYSLIQNWNPSGTGNLNGIPNAATANYPNFVTPLDPATAPSTAGDFHIQAVTPVANVGTSTDAPTTDLFGNARPFGAAFDLGVHELQGPNTAGCPATGSVWFVDAAAASGGTGSSWACAFQNLQDAIDAASSGHEIWVKTGTYFPTKDPSGNANPADPRDKVFYLKNGAAVYGGFAGTETARSQRNWISNPTILSGDIGTANVNTDNCYHVVLSVSDANTTVLDGLNIEKGNANGTGSLTVETKTIARNQGGGAFNQNSALQISNCKFSANSASASGAGMFNGQ